MAELLLSSEWRKKDSSRAAASLFDSGTPLMGLEAGFPESPPVGFKTAMTCATPMALNCWIICPGIINSPIFPLLLPQDWRFGDYLFGGKISLSSDNRND